MIARAGLLLCAVGVVFSGPIIEFPAGFMPGVGAAGIGYLKQQIKVVDDTLVNAINVFKPINSTCQGLVSQQIPKCEKCVVAKCTARGENVCAPAEWQKVLGNTINFFKSGVPNFFTQSIPDVFVNKIGGGIVDLGSDIGDFVSGGVIDLGNSIKDIGSGIGGGVVDFGKNIGNKVVDIGSAAIDKIKDIGSSIGDAFKSIGSIFGKRGLGDQPPSCDDLSDSNTAGKACQYYVKKCSDCAVDTATLCPGYKAAVDKIQAANAVRTWRTKMGTSTTYEVTKMKYDAATIDPMTGGYSNVEVFVNIFGKSVSFLADKPITAFNPVVAGPVVARQALDAFKKA